MSAVPEVVWFKRDLRVADHRPLRLAAERGPVLPLYVYEPELWGPTELDATHLAFINASLEEVDHGLAERGARLAYRFGALPEVFEALWQQFRFDRLWSHEESGNWVTYMRDLRVKAWAESRGVEWIEVPQCGVVRPLPRRDGWAQKWNRRMSAPPVSAPRAVPGWRPGDAESTFFEGPRGPGELGIDPGVRPEAQAGGERLGLQTIKSFLRRRGVNYRADMSSPVSGWDGCSRLSAYLAWGNVSIRQVHHATEARLVGAREARRSGAAIDERWIPSLVSFQKRLRWHCHFMQKLEDEPRIEFENMSRAYDGLREDEFSEERFEAWLAGRTGYPMIDACMRAVAASGWLNFRMRAMVVSFSSYYLWLHWRRPAFALGRMFLDFEPGIHYSQFQMQSGTTGINALRIYSPTKQARDQDPTGVFIRRYVPELAGVPDEHLAEPHRMPATVQRQSGCVVGVDYPKPLVAASTAVARAKKRLAEVRRSDAAKSQAEKVLRRHGSRKRPSSASRRTQGAR